MIKNNKSLMAKLLISTALICIIGIGNDINAYAFEQNIDSSLVNDAESNYSNVSSKETIEKSQSNSKTEGIKQKILKEINAYNEEIYFDSSYGIVKDSETDLSSLYYELSYEHPEIFWISFKLSIYYNSDGSVKLYLRNIYDDDTITKKRTELNNKVDDIIIKYASYNNLRKVYEIHDYILKNVTYNNNSLAINVPSSTINSKKNREDYFEDEKRIAKEYASYYENYTAYGALINGTSVCEGYSKAFSLLSNKYGIETGIVSSSTASHAWNYVNINGKYYQLDLTWDDQNDEKNLYQYKYFNMTNNQTKIVHDWTSTNAPLCTDSTYDNILRTVSNEKIKANNIVRIEDNLYGLEYVSSRNNYDLFMVDLDGGNKKIIRNNINAFNLLVKNNNLYYTIHKNGNAESSSSINIEKYNPNNNQTSVFLDLKKEFDFTSDVYSSTSYIDGNSIIVNFRKGLSYNPTITKEFSLNSGTILTDLEKIN